MSYQLTPRTILTIIFLSFAGEIAWAVENQYFNVFIYDIISPNTLYVSLIVTFSAITATATAITLGALSDKLGRRKVFFLIGFPMWALTTGIFPLTGYMRPIILAISMAIVFDCVMTFFGSMASDAALKAYSIDVTTIKNRGKINAVMQVTLLTATLVVYAGSGFIIESLGFYIFFYIIGGIVAIFGTIGAVLAPKIKINVSEEKYWNTLKSTLSIRELRNNKDLFYVFIATMLWSISFNVFFPYILIYLEHRVGLEYITASIFMFVVILIAIIVAVPMGIVVDKIGRKKIAFIAIITEMVSLTLFGISENIYVVAIFGALVMIGMTVWDVAVKTWTKDLYPEEKRGQFSGYYIIFTVMVAMATGPFIGDSITKNLGGVKLLHYMGNLVLEGIDSTTILGGVAGYIPPSWVFIIAGIMLIVVFIPVIFAKDTKELMKEKINKEFT